MSNLSGNKGEWSEVYVFLRLLAIGKLYAADEKLEKQNNVFYNIINIVRQEHSQVLEFFVNQKDGIISISTPETSAPLLTISQKEFNDTADVLLKEILNSKQRAFSLPDIEFFLSKIRIQTLKAKSNDKSDICIKIHDINTGYEILQGFSIKSRLGSPSTLVNASKATTFIYKIDGQITDKVMEDFNREERFEDKSKVLQSHNCQLSYYDVKDTTFKNNLLLIDGDLPKICAFMLECSFMQRLKSIVKNLQLLKARNPLQYDLSQGHPFYEYKFKKFLTDSALGMLPATTWNGLADATGGYIIVREDGEVLCYHLFNRNDFENYLVQNTKFETSSTSKHDFGYIYKKDGGYYLDLNLQIRFIR